jgi:fatty acyl-CoA reductase
MNIEGTQMMVDLARKMPQLKAFVHTSTAFSHCYHEHIEEKFYPCTAFTPDDIIDLCKTSDTEGGLIMKNVVRHANI